MKKILISATLLAFMFGCKKSSDPAPSTTNTTSTTSGTTTGTTTTGTTTTGTTTTKTAKEYLTAHGWKCTKVVNNNIDITSQQDACGMDNIQTFSSNGSYEETEGATKFYSSDPNIFDHGLYTLSSDGKTLSTTSVDEIVPTVVTVLQLDDNTLKFSYFDIATNSTTVSTYSK